MNYTTKTIAQKLSQELFASLTGGDMKREPQVKKAFIVLGGVPANTFQIDLINGKSFKVTVAKI